MAPTSQRASPYLLLLKYLHFLRSELTAWLKALNMHLQQWLFFSREQVRPNFLLLWVHFQGPREANNCTNKISMINITEKKQGGGRANTEGRGPFWSGKSTRTSQESGISAKTWRRPGIQHADTEPKKLLMKGASQCQDLRVTSPNDWQLWVAWVAS
jgi:hypothetical protein